MAVNMSKNGTELMAAYRDVVDARSDINWLLLTYEGNSNAIRLAGKGGGGLEEMVDELNSGKVMYAFCRVRHPDSGLPKYVLVNWTGEGVKDTRKGMCANHLSTIANFLKGAHVTINARDEDDVDPELILSKVSKASGADYDFRRGAAPQPGDIPRGVVGSVYRKTNAREEIQQIDKDSFWSQTQREEEVRRKEEVKKAELQRRALEEERRNLEEKHAKEREQKIQQRNSAIDHNRLLQKQRDKEEREIEERRQNLARDDDRTAAVSTPTSVRVANEAKALISQRAFDPRDVFQPHKSIFDGGDGGSAPAVGKLRSPFLSQQAFDSPFPPLDRPRFETPPSREDLRPVDFPVGSRSPPSLSPHIGAPAEDFASRADDFASRADDFASRADDFASRADDFASRPDDFASRPDNFASSAFSSVSPAGAARDAAEDDDWSDEYDEELYQVPGREHLKSLTESMFPTPVEENQYAVPRPVDAELYKDVGQDARAAQGDEEEVESLQNLSARAVYDYQAADDTEITFDPDDIITCIEMVDEGWWRGYGPDGRYGMFPANYVELL
ncbi:drebrin-like protein B [Corythoichthys intestinalis]|uniref:drebrin-like protein B n=1 Tax=Corythoichthys intestinalis TaxID=161448 RepID=UPI0025A5A7C6|nr:drebrin-like protein B [Corythoichthys intestinalis]